MHKGSSMAKMGLSRFVFGVLSCLALGLAITGAWAASQVAVDGTFSGSWRAYSQRLDYDKGGHGVADAGMATHFLVLGADGTWTFGTSAGKWTVAAVTDSDWKRWQTRPYGPKRKILLQGWAGRAADGPVEESGGRVDFIWLIYHVEKPSPGLIQIKFGHAKK